MLLFTGVGLVLIVASLSRPGMANPPMTAMVGAPARNTPSVVVPGPSVYERPGVTASLGLGYAYGVLGGQIRYDRPLRPWLHLAPFVAGGFHYERVVVAGAIGMSVGFGRRQRLVVDLAVAPVQWQELNLHGTTIDFRTIYGPTVGVGYEDVSESGVMRRITFGYGWGMWGKGEGLFSSRLSVTFGAGGRLW